MLLPERKYRGIWHRILHDQTAEGIEKAVSTLAHANVTTVPFHFDATKRDEIIVDMCAIRPLSIEDLATMLDRSVPHMRAILRPLIRQGRIQYLYPAQPRSRKQRYTVSGVSD